MRLSDVFEWLGRLDLKTLAFWYGITVFAVCVLGLVVLILFLLWSTSPWLAVGVAVGVSAICAIFWSIE